MTIKEVAARLGVYPERVGALIRIGGRRVGGGDKVKLRATKIYAGALWVWDVTEDDLAEFLALWDRREKDPGPSTGYKHKKGEG